MYTNKASVPNSYNNTITVTAIKMEINDAPASQEHSSNMTDVSNTGNQNVESGGGIRLTYFPTTVNSSYCTTTAGTNAVHTASVTIKEKLVKGMKQFTPRKPPPTIENFWPNILNEVQNTQMVDAKHQALPLARIKKIMKLDENAKMIAAEAPLLFAKACELFIQELTMRAWIHTEESKRRTLQRSDIAQAIANYDQFDFLIDIVPREDIKPSGHHRKHDNSHAQGAGTATTSSTATVATGTSGVSAVPVDMISVTTLSNEPVNAVPIPQVVATPAIATNPNTQTAHVVTSGQSPQQVQIIQQTSHHPAQHMQYFITLPGQASGQPQLVHQLQLQQQQQQLPPTIGTPLNFITQQPQQLILTTAPSSASTTLSGVSAQQQQTNALLQSIAQHQQQQQQQQQQIQLVQQVLVTPSGELANVPIAINANQLNLLRLQMQQQQQQQQQQSQQTHQATQQIIIPTQVLSTQQLLQLQSQNPNTVQIQQQHNTQQPTNSIFIHTTHPTGHSTNTNTTTASSSTDRNISGGFRSNC